MVIGCFQICSRPSKWCLIRSSNASVHLKIRSPDNTLWTVAAQYSQWGDNRFMVLLCHHSRRNRQYNSKPITLELFIHNVDVLPFWWYKYNMFVVFYHECTHKSYDSIIRGGQRNQQADEQFKIYIKTCLWLNCSVISHYQAQGSSIRLKTCHTLNTATVQLNSYKHTNAVFVCILRI